MQSSQRGLHNGTTFFCNVDCEYFPCHEGVDAREFNCLFCYCPLYALGPRCGGDYRYTTAGVKDCSPCTRPHRGNEGIELVREHFAELAELARITPADQRDEERS